MAPSYGRLRGPSFVTDRRVVVAFAFTVVVVVIVVDVDIVVVVVYDTVVSAALRAHFK